MYGENYRRLPCTSTYELVDDISPDSKMPTVTFPGRPLASFPVLSFFYKLFYSSTILARLPVWILSFSFRSQRPLPTVSNFRKILE